MKSFALTFLLVVALGAVAPKPEHAACFMTVAGGFAPVWAQEQPPREQPSPEETVGDEDPNPQHRGQPKTCANRSELKASVHDCACHRAKATACERDPSENSSCRVHCRADMCRCSPKHCETD